MNDSDKTVIIWGADWCGPCHVTKDYLTKKGVKYEYRNVDDKREWAEEAVSKSGQTGIPVIEIGGDTIVVGFDLPKLNAALSL